MRMTQNESFSNRHIVGGPHIGSQLTIRILIRRIQNTEADAFYKIKNQKSEKRKNRPERTKKREPTEKPENIFNRALYNFITAHV